MFVDWEVQSGVCGFLSLYRVAVRRNLRSLGFIVFKDLNTKIATLERFATNNRDRRIVLIHPIHDLLAITWVGTKGSNVELGGVIVHEDHIVGRPGLEIVKNPPLSQD